MKSKRYKPDYSFLSDPDITQEEIDSNFVRISQEMADAPYVPPNKITILYGIVKRRMTPRPLLSFDAISILDLAIIDIQESENKNKQLPPYLSKDINKISRELHRFSSNQLKAHIVDNYTSLEDLKKTTTIT